jgi:ribosomal protein S18 acetylase RimI-like enzyme
MEAPFRIRSATGQNDIDTVKALFRRYQEWLDTPVCFDEFETELADLPGKYAEPDGCLLLATLPDGLDVGVAAVRPLRSHSCELKRLYALPEFRGVGIGRALTEAAIAFACNAGNRSMTLETLPKLERAISMYKKMGFSISKAKKPDVTDEVVYMTKALSRIEPHG